MDNEAEKARMQRDAQPAAFSNQPPFLKGTQATHLTHNVHRSHTEKERGMDSSARTFSFPS